jgi:hypothetical protein
MRSIRRSLVPKPKMKKRSKKSAPATPIKKPNYLAQMMGQKRM